MLKAGGLRHMSKKREKWVEFDDLGEFWYNHHILLKGE